jgi:hypothetical protein
MAVQAEDLSVMAELSTVASSAKGNEGFSIRSVRSVNAPDTGLYGQRERLHC